MSSPFALLTEEQHWSWSIIEDIARYERGNRVEAERRASLPAEPRVPGETVYATTGPHTGGAVVVTVLERQDSNESISTLMSCASSMPSPPPTPPRIPTPSPPRELTPEERYARGLARFHKLEGMLMRKQERRADALAVQRARLNGGTVAAQRVRTLTRQRSSSQSTLPIKPWY